MTTLLETRIANLKKKDWYQPPTANIVGLLKPWLTTGEWFETRPKAIQELILEYPPWCLYSLGSGQQVVVIHAYTEDTEGDNHTFKVLVLEEFNSPLEHEERLVFGISPDDLTPICIDPNTLKAFEESCGDAQ